MNSSVSLSRSIAELRAELAPLRAAGRPIALVPTMGDLHEGHLELVRVAARMGEPVVSIFVNPTQFGAGEDFQSYPRDLEGDCAKLASLGARVLRVFAPEVSEIYDRDASTYVEVEGVSEPLCGIHRPGHFRGVATVVSKLFAIVAPDLAIFGEKDAQQCLVLRKMVRDLRLPLRLLFVPTVRERDGLAMSSRNRYLQAGERELAVRISRGLQAGRAVLESGERGVQAVEASMRDACEGLDLDYAELRTLPALERIERAHGQVLLAIAARIGRARLIDNRALQVEGDAVFDAALSEKNSEAEVRRQLRADGFAVAEENER